MTTMNDGGPAFPGSIPSTSGEWSYSQMGMSLRDWFAGQAIAGAFATQSRDADVAEWAYNIADAMLAAREVRP